MRQRKHFISIKVSEEVYNRLLEDRSHFQETIGGGKWSISDTITEYLKLLDIVRVPPSIPEEDSKNEKVSR